MFGRCNIGFEHLVDFALGQLGDEEVASLEGHLNQGCTRCQKEVDWLREVVGTMQSDQSVEPPDWVYQRAVRLFQRQFPAPTPAAPLLKRIAATLVFDSRLAMVPAGVRGSTASARQLLYTAGDLDIDLQIEPGDRETEFTLMGQVLPTSGELGTVAGAEVHLLRGHRKVLSRNTDPLGEFVFGRLAPGKYALRIRLGRREVDLVGIDM